MSTEKCANNQNADDKSTLAKGNNYRMTSDGALIEGTGIGGKVLIVHKTPEFMRYVAPYFAPSFILVFAHIIYAYTGNLLFPVWLMFLACPIMNALLPEDNENLAQKCEKAFHNDKRFWLPLYVFSFLETITWIWALIVISDDFNPEYRWFKTKP